MISVAAGERGQQPARGQRDAVRRAVAPVRRSFREPVIEPARHLVDPLVQGAAERDIQLLDAAADRQHRHVAPHRLANQRQCRRVAVADRAACLVDGSARRRNGWGRHSRGCRSAADRRAGRAARKYRSSCPIAGISTGKQPAASITAFGYRSLTAWNTRSLTCAGRRECRRAAYDGRASRRGSGFVLAARGRVRILIYKQLGVERHTELLVVQGNRRRLALLIDDRPLPQGERISLNTIVRLPMSGSSCSTTVIRNAFAPRSNRVTTRSAKVIGSRSSNHAGVDFSPTLDISSQLLVHVIHVEICRRAAGSATGGSYSKPHSPRPRHPQLAGGGAIAGGYLLKPRVHRADAVQIGGDALQFGGVLRGQRHGNRRRGDGAGRRHCTAAAKPAAIRSRRPILLEMPRRRPLAPVLPNDHRLALPVASGGTERQMSRRVRLLQLRSIAAARQNLALADMVGGADDPFGLHALDDPGGAVVADLQMALHKAGRRLALAAHHRDRLRV